MFNTIREYAGVVALVAIVLLFLTGGKTKFGQIVDTSYFDYFQATTGFQLGSSLTFLNSSGLLVNSTSDRVARINKGNCNLFSGPGITSIAATSTVQLDCQATSGGASSTPLTGVTAGDYCSLHLATTSPTTNLGLGILSYGASTTQGYISAKVINLTGGAYTLTSSATSTLEYICMR